MIGFIAIAIALPEFKGFQRDLYFLSRDRCYLRLSPRCFKNQQKINVGSKKKRQQQDFCPLEIEPYHLIIIIIMVYLQYSNKREALTTVNAIFTIKK